MCRTDPSISRLNSPYPIRNSEFACSRYLSPRYTFSAERTFAKTFTCPIRFPPYHALDPWTSRHSQAHLSGPVSAQSGFWVQATRNCANSIFPSSDFANPIAPYRIGFAAPGSGSGARNGALEGNFETQYLASTSTPKCQSKRARIASGCVSRRTCTIRFGEVNLFLSIWITI